MAFKLLLTENQSALGRAIYQGLEDYPYALVCPPTASSNWQDADAIRHCLDSHNPSLLINTLAHTESGPEASQLLADVCAQYQVVCLHLSSYRVFGSGHCPDSGYEEADIPEPDDEPGKNLLAVETAFKALDKALILRLPWLIDARGDNLFTRVSSQLASGKPLVVSDVRRGCPTTLDDVQRVVVAIIQQVFCGAENWGFFHLRTADVCSEAEFADCVARLLEKEGEMVAEIEIRRDQESPLVPGCGLLRGVRLMNNFGIQPRSWRLGVKPLVKAWVKSFKP